MAIDDLQHIDLNNPEFQDAWDLIQHTHRSLFLTGKAGTGKSTFLKYIRDNTKKKTVVLAPTGIAAVNVGGQTMHSFFKIPFKPMLPDDPDYANPARMRKMLRYTKEKVKLIQCGPISSILWTGSYGFIQVTCVSPSAASSCCSWVTFSSWSRL